jgi:hypothetical protein
MITHLDFHNFEFRIDENEAKDFSFFYRDGLFEFFEVGNFTKSESCKEDSCFSGCNCYNKNAENFPF